MRENLAHLYLTELMGLVVYDLRGRRIGKIRDAALMPVVDPMRVDRFLVGGAWTWLAFRYDQVKSVTLDGIHLKDEILTPYHSDEYMLRLVRDLLDQQIIDSHGRKVVRVTDVTFEVRHGCELYVQEIDVGLRSVFRRVLQGAMPGGWIRRLQGPIPVNSIRWEFVNILEADPQRRLRLNISTRRLEEMHPADLADIVEELGPDDREAIIEAMDSEKAAEILEEVEPDVQASILESLETGKAADILEEMSPDEAADALGELKEETSAEILEEMESAPKEEVAELLEFEQDTAGGLMNTEYVAAPEEGRVADALEAIRGARELRDNLNTVFLVDESGRLRGAVPVARLVMAGPEAPLAEIMKNEAVISVRDTASEEEVTGMFDKYNLLSLPVADQHGVLVGVITADDVISVLRRR